MTPVSDISQTACEGDQIDTIRYDYSGGAIGVTVDWSIDGSPPSATTPTGLVMSNNAGILTISGTPLITSHLRPNLNILLRPSIVAVPLRRATLV